MPLPDSLQIQPLIEMLSIPSHSIPYSPTEGTLTIPITFCLLLSNISVLFPSEELPARQPAPPYQSSVISTDFPSSQFLTFILRKLPSFTLMLVAPCSNHLYVSLPWSTHLPCTSHSAFCSLKEPFFWPGLQQELLFPTSVIPSSLSDLFPNLSCPSSYPLTCSFHYFHLIRLKKSHPISAHFLLLYLSFLAQIDRRLALFLTLLSYLMNYEVCLPNTYLSLPSASNSWLICDQVYFIHNHLIASPSSYAILINFLPTFPS